MLVFFFKSTLVSDFCPVQELSGRKVRMHSTGYEEAHESQRVSQNGVQFILLVSYPQHPRAPPSTGLQPPWSQLRREERGGEDGKQMQLPENSARF